MIQWTEWELNICLFYIHQISLNQTDVQQFWDLKDRGIYAP